VNSAEIRETFLAYFEERDHLRVPSASLVPSAHDPTVLLTTAGMQPLKPYFLGFERPPAERLTSCQRCFRTTDIEEVGNTARHLTFFEMLGNFSIGSYFKEESIGFGWELSTGGLGLDPERIWVTVFEGDEKLGLGPDAESIEIWRAAGVPEERIVRLPRSENFWQSGPLGPCGPCSEMYYDRGEGYGGPEERPGDEGERYLEYWNHVFMAYELHEDGLVDLPGRNIDTGLGVERMAAIKQDVPSVFETDLFRPLIELAEELSGRSYSDGGETTRAMRILADHSRGMTELIADGVVPSNEDRGYILRRIMRRAIQQGRVLELESPYMERFATRTIELLADAHPQLAVERETVMRWVGAEERSFGRTLDRGTELLSGVIAAAREAGTSAVDAEEAFQLHDTYGFPFELTRELLAEQGLSVDDAGFETLMEEQRTRARTGATTATLDRHDVVSAFIAGAPPSEFVGYEELRAETSVAAARELEDGGTPRALVKLEESPFYAEGGGQIADSGRLRWNGSDARVVDVYRMGDDQTLLIEPAASSAPLPGAAGLEEGSASRPGGAGADEGQNTWGDRLPRPGTRVEATVERAPRHATMRNHTATHLLHAALRERLGAHVRQAGSAVGPDKLRFDFTHGEPLSAEDVAWVEDRVNGWIKDSLPVRAIEMERAEAERLGAMALFGEKYGDWVRVVEVAGVSRELCGGTHVANTAEIGIFRLASEGSSAANVRRIEALTGPAAIDWHRERSARLDEVAALLGSPQDALAGARRAADQLEELERARAEAGSEEAGELAATLAAAGETVSEIEVFVGDAPIADPNALLDVADRVRAGSGAAAAVVLGGAEDGRVGIVASFGEGAVERGLSAADVVREAAAVVGGGGGGRANVARAGGRDPEKLGEALRVARQAIERGLGG